MTRRAGPRYLFTLVAIAAAAVTWTILDRPARPRPVPVASAASVPTARPKVGPAPTARELLAREDTLALTTAQRARLETLAAAWARESASLEASADAARAAFAGFVAERQQAGRVRLDEVQRRSVDVQRLSATLRERRARHSEEAAGVLTERQRARLARVDATPGGTR